MATSEETAHKIFIAKEKKEAGDSAFKAGDLATALRAYHEAVMYLEGISKNGANNLPFPTAAAAPLDQSTEAKPKSESDEILEKIYSNMSACQIKKGNWKRAVECADKALAKNSENNKALFRKGKALGELGFFERADAILSGLLEKDPPDAPAIKAELDRLRGIDKEREKKHNQKFRGFLNRDRGAKLHVEEPRGAHIEEVVEVDGPTAN